MKAFGQLNFRTEKFNCSKVFNSSDIYNRREDTNFSHATVKELYTVIGDPSFKVNFHIVLVNSNAVESMEVPLLFVSSQFCNLENSFQTYVLC